MLETGELSHLREWIGFLTIRGSEQSPNATKWDDPLTVQRKAEAKAKNRNAQRPPARRGRRRR